MTNDKKWESIFETEWETPLTDDPLVELESRLSVRNCKSKPLYYYYSNPGESTHPMWNHKKKDQDD